MDKDCLFCKIVAGEIPSYKIFEDADFIGIVDIQPVNLGHALLIPKAHARNLFDLADPALQGLGYATQLLAKAVKSATSADGVNIIMNNEGAADQVIMHPHLHIIPRFKDDGLEPWHCKVKPSPEELTAIADKIKTEL